MKTGLYDSIRTACAQVAQQAYFVHINPSRLKDYASAIPLQQIVEIAHDPNAHYLDHDDATVAFFITLDTINFGSGYFPFLQKRPGMSGYFTVASALNDHFQKHGAFSPQALVDMTVSDCTSLFGQDPANEPIQQLMGLFAQALNDLGRFLISRFDGSFMNLLDAAQHSAEVLTGLLSEMPYFRDIEQYGDLEVPFYKRAQLAASDLALAFHNSGAGYFSDLTQLTIFADNLVPHVLRMDGVLTYEQALANQIDSEQLIPSGSREEIEIRACALHTVELLVAELNRQGQAVCAMQLDNLLWNRGQRPFYKQTKPRHRTRSVFY